LIFKTEKSKHWRNWNAFLTLGW